MQANCSCNAAAAPVKHGQTSLHIIACNAHAHAKGYSQTWVVMSLYQTHMHVLLKNSMVIQVAKNELKGCQ
jgi:hypothetical protein